MAQTCKYEIEKRENRLTALLARERSERGKVEIKNAQLEGKVEEMIE
jgi:hypothetical protein